jgi:tRNA dimethylallyltransferase
VELVSIDAMAVYRGLDIGTAKPTDEERRGLRWHLIDVVAASEEFSVATFQAAFRRSFTDIEQRERRALLVGGSGLYHRAAVDGLELAGRFPQIVEELEVEADRAGGLERLYRRLELVDPAAARRMEPTNRRRIVRALEVTEGSGRCFSSFGLGLESYAPSSFVLVGLSLPRAQLAARIERRLDEQLDGGLLEEVVRLAKSPGGLSATASQALAYRELLAHIAGECSLSEARSLILTRTRRFARRQEAWFRRDPRVIWLDALDPALVDRLDDLLEGAQQGQDRTRS